MTAKDDKVTPSRPKTSRIGDALSRAGAKVASPSPELPAANPVASDVSPARKEKPASRRETVPLTVHVPEAVRRQLKALAAEEGRSMEAMVGQALNMLFAQHRRPEIAPQD